MSHALRLDLPTFDPTAAGLCANCDRRNGCTWSLHALSPIWHCSEHTVAAPAAIVRPPSSPPAAPRRDATGLCVNCAHADACSLPGRALGVWTCEEHD